MSEISRRDFVMQSSLAVGAVAAGRLAIAEGRKPGDTKQMTLGFSTYGMKKLLSLIHI